MLSWGRAVLAFVSVVPAAGLCLSKAQERPIRVEVDLGREKRTIFAGLAQHVDCASLVGRQVVVLANLKPRKMRFGVSEGMILAAEGIDGRLAVLSPVDTLFPGATIS